MSKLSARLFFDGLLREMPEDDQEWIPEQRQKWRRAALGIVDVLAFGDTEQAVGDDPVEPAKEQR